MKFERHGISIGSERTAIKERGKMIKMVPTLSLALLLASGSAYARENNGTVIAPPVQKDGIVLLDGTYDYLGSLKKYAFHSIIINRDTADGKTVVTERHSDVKAKRPDQFRIDSKGKNFNRSSYLSDGTFNMIDNGEKYYASVKTGKGIDGTFDIINNKLKIVVPLPTLLRSDMDKFIHPKRVQYFGTRMVSGVECNYIAFRQGPAVVHLWIENSDTPLIHSAKIVTDDKHGKGTTNMTITWDTKPDFSDSVFIFKAPKGASNISNTL